MQVLGARRAWVEFSEGRSAGSGCRFGRMEKNAPVVVWRRLGGVGVAIAVAVVAVVAILLWRSSSQPGVVASQSGSGGSAAQGVWGGTGFGFASHPPPPYRTYSLNGVAAFSPSSAWIVGRRPGSGTSTSGF